MRLSLDERLLQAEERRQVRVLPLFVGSVSTCHPFVHARSRSRTHKRPTTQSFLESIRLKAATTTKRKERVDQFQALQYLDDDERRERFTSRLNGASERKRDLERERAAAARRHYEMVIERVEEMKERGRVEAVKRREQCDERLEQAARRRASARVDERTSSSAEVNVGEMKGLDEMKELNALNEVNVLKGRVRERSPSSLAPRRRAGKDTTTMTYERAVEILRKSGIHYHSSKPGVNSVHQHSSDLIPPPMNHPSVTMPFDRFAQLIGDQQVLLATQRVLMELLDDGVHGSNDENKTKKALDMKINPRVFLSAYMIVNYPGVVLSGQGGHAGGMASDATQEARLSEAARRVIGSFGVAVFGDKGGGGEEESTDDDADLLDSHHWDANHRIMFASRYAMYHDQFTTWKSHDAAGLENDLIKAAVELESSRLVKLGEVLERAASIGVRHQVDVDALTEGVEHDLGLIAERVASLTGGSGVARLKAALEAVKAAHVGIWGATRVTDAGTGDVVPGSPHGGSLATSPLKTSPLRKMSRREVEGVSQNTMDVETTKPDNVQIPTLQSPKGKTPKNPNLNLMWGLLYDASWRLPTRALELVSEEILGGTIDMSPLSGDEVRSLEAERRTWVELQASLEDDAEEKVFVVCKVLKDITSKLQEHARGVDIERKMLEIQESLIPKGSGSYWMDLPAFLDAVQWCSSLISEMCAPARDADVRRAQNIIGERFRSLQASANTDDETDNMCGSYVTMTVLQALHILQLQSRILGIDVANAHLEALASHSMSFSWRIQYARARLGEELGLEMDLDTHGDSFTESIVSPSLSSSPSSSASVASAAFTSFRASLGNTRGWIAVASGRLPRIETAMASSSLNGCPTQQNVSTLAPSTTSPATFPIRMRTGTIETISPLSSRSLWTSTRALEGVSPLESINSMRCWRGLVRVGLVHLISGDGAIGSMNVPETLLRDVPRLFALQNDFQKCLVLVICLTIIDPSRTCISPVLAASRKRDAATRIKVILDDPEITIDHVAAEVSSCMMSLGSAGSNDPVEDPVKVSDFDALQTQVLGTLKTLLHRSSCRVLIEHLTNMLVSVLVTDDASSFVYETCDKIGAAEIYDDIFDLGRKIGEVAAVSEAVCGPWYAAIATEFA